MKNRESLLLIIIMVVSASLVAFLYSPVVTKNDFGSDGFGLNPGVNFGGGVENAKKRENSFSIPDRSMPIFTADASNYANSPFQKSGNSSAESPKGNQYSNNYKVNNSRDLAESRAQVSSYSGMSPNEIGGTFTKSRSNRLNNNALMSLNTSNLNSSKQEMPKMPEANYELNTNDVSSGFMAVVSDVSNNLTIDNIGMQKTTVSGSGRLTDPGKLDFETYQDKSTLPIPDGTYYLLFLAIGYMLFKRRWVPKSKRLSPKVPEEEYQMNYENTTLDKYIY